MSAHLLICKNQDHWGQVSKETFCHEKLHSSNIVHILSIIISIIIPNRVYWFSELQPKDGENVGAGGGGSSACSAPDSNCPCNWIGDQICDDVCNVAAHNFDNGDCADDYAGPEYGGVGDGEEESEGDCPDDWIGDLICDDECNVAAHNFDNGDCCLPADEIDTSMCDACECLQ